MITRAFVLAAGMGTRLRPLTDALPKPLVPIFQKALITFALDHLIDAVPKKIGLGDKIRNAVENVRMQKRVRELDIE